MNLLPFTVKAKKEKSGMRAMAATIQGLFQTGIGFGVTPPLLGLSNDLMKPYYGELAIRYSMALTLAISLIIIGFSLLGARWLLADYAKLHGAAGKE